MSEPTTDYALLEHQGAWMHHPVYGDPSWDAFERLPGNPVWRGVDGLEWPVNGFLFEDPASGDWFLYVGHYARGYALGPGIRCRCTVFRSRDRGRSWDHLGPVFDDPSFRFDGDAEAAGAAPDVTVTWADGRYHMVYDWIGSEATWKEARTRRAGLGYAWSERPEGPYRRHAVPIVRNDVPAREPILGKYDRLYGATIVRRARDWLVLSLVDSGPHFAWGLVGMTAPAPEGPYGAPTPLLHVEGDRFQPPLMECFPCFVRDGFVYAPATSVALNRGYQTLHRAPVEEAMHPDAWELCRHGSGWHDLPVENEHHGIWGQTWSGFVDDRGTLQVMFPSKDGADRGTINLAARPWYEPYRRRGFRLAGRSGPAMALLTGTWGAFAVDLELEARGTVALFWAYESPLGPDAPRSNASIHPRSLPSGPLVELHERAWEVRDAKCRRVAGGDRQSPVLRELSVVRGAAGPVRVLAAGATLWEGELGAGGGCIGLLVGRASYVAVDRFAVRGTPSAGRIDHLGAEALLGAGQSLADWEQVESALFRHGCGFVSRSGRGRAKWNVVCSGYTIWSPRAPEYGEAEVVVDGSTAGRIDLRSPAPRAAEAVFSMDGLPEGPHAVVLRGEGRLPVDCLEARRPAPAL